MFDQRVGDAVLLVQAAEAELRNSNIHKAKGYYVRAGDLLVSLAPKHGLLYERNLVFYSAGVSYWNAGEYQKAVMTTSLVQIAKMGALQEEISQFYNDAKVRSVNYPITAIKEFDKLMASADCTNRPTTYLKRALLHLLEHPYMIPPVDMTKLRIRLLQDLNRHEEANWFVEDLRRLEAETDSAAQRQSP